jgi:hypothetical protein
MSIVASIRSQLVPVNQEGYPFIATFGIAKPDAVPICQAHLAGVPDVCSLNTMPTGPRASSFALRSPSGRPPKQRAPGRNTSILIGFNAHRKEWRRYKEDNRKAAIARVAS